MNIQQHPTLSPDTQVILDALQQAVANALERKRRLGYYAVPWSGSAPMIVGEDAPEQLRARHLNVEVSDH
jgi:hypothetical protein